MRDFQSYKTLTDQLEKAKLLSINRNMLSVHRTDSTDAILERLNVSGGLAESTGNSAKNMAMINRISLKLNDLNKEQEYVQLGISNK